MALSDLTSEAKDTARKLVEGWDQREIDQIFWLVDITAGNARSIQVAGGIGYNLKTWTPSLGCLYELQAQGLLDIDEEMAITSRSRKWKILLRQQLKDAVTSNFSPTQKETVPAMKSRYRHLSDAAKTFATKLVDHYKAGKISRSLVLLIHTGDDEILGVSPTNPDDDITISLGEYRLISDLQSEELITLQFLGGASIEILLVKSLFDAVEANFEVPDIANTDRSMNTNDIARSKRVFIVHGHEDGIKEASARTLERLGFEAIILHEQPNMGRTVIEKFEANAEDAGFAVILLTPDDLVCENTDSSNQKKYRARQNVILELGYFYGKLGRSRVVALKAGGDDIEIPSDILGIVYISYDAAGHWRFELAKELQAAGYSVDMNVLLK